MQNSIM